MTISLQSKGAIQAATTARSEQRENHHQFGNRESTPWQLNCYVGDTLLDWRPCHTPAPWSHHTPAPVVHTIAQLRGLAALMIRQQDGIKLCKTLSGSL